jgi:hypothetical protein
MTTRDTHTMPRASRAFIELTLHHVRRRLNGEGSMTDDDLTSMVTEALIEIRINNPQRKASQP